MTGDEIMEALRLANAALAKAEARIGRLLRIEAALRTIEQSKRSWKRFADECNAGTADGHVNDQPWWEPMMDAQHELHELSAELANEAEATAAGEAAS